TDVGASERFFIEGVGFKVSDTVRGLAVFLRCSTDHHNLLIQQAPVDFLHHTSWQVDDVDEIGRGATAMLEKDPARHVWGLGRHHIGANFFWYLKDPAGNLTEYDADLDCGLDDQLWKPGVWDGARSLSSAGPPAPVAGGWSPRLVGRAWVRRCPCPRSVPVSLPTATRSPGVSSRRARFVAVTRSGASTTSSGAASRCSAAPAIRRASYRRTSQPSSPRSAASAPMWLRADPFTT